ncbi:hypothetical protein H5T51_08195 [Candidatus Bathyarchaeota archaeon]|nr:hypothetical protein [Candidatus Bathyarchaeota archaeon]
MIDLKQFKFIEKHKNLTEVLMDHDLASLGDAYINFIYSLALSKKKGKPSGAKVKGSVLAEAIKQTDLRQNMPSRISRHTMADAAEALAVYAWLHNYITLEECVEILYQSEDGVEGFIELFQAIKKRIKL